MKQPLRWHLGAGDAPGRGDELWLLGGDCVSFMMPLSSLEVTILWPPAVPFPVASWVSCPGAGDRQEVATGSCIPALGPAITRCVLLHESKSSGCSRGSGWCLSSSLQPFPPAASGLPVSSQRPAGAQG